MFNIEALPVFAVDDVAHADDPALTIGFRFTPERGSSRPSSPTKRKPQVVVKSATSPVATPTKVAITTSTTDLQQRATLASSTLDNAPIELESLPRKSPSKDQSKTSVANLLIQNAQERIVGQLTRAQRARLCVPGHFTPVHDARGLIVDTVVVGAASTRLKSDMNAVALSKWADVQCSREIGITLLGLSQLQSEHVHALYFTVQFAAFPLVQSQFVVLGRKAPETVDDDGMTMTAKSSSGGMDTVMPQLFYPGTGNNHFVADDKGVPGVYLKFEWDDRAHASIAQQLLRPDAAIHVDVWSAESRLPLASVSIPSVLLLRGDPTLAQSSMYDFPLDAPHASTELGPLLTRSAVQGLLHVRLSSVPYATVALDNAWSCQVGDTVRSGRGVAFGRAMPVKLVDYRESLRHQRTASGTLRVKAEKVRRREGTGFVWCR